MSKSKCCGKDVLVCIIPKYNECGDMVAMEEEGRICSKCWEECEVEEEEKEE